MRCIFYYPLDPNNSYSERMRQLLSEFGEVRAFTILGPLGYFLSNFGRRADFIFLNWIEHKFFTKSGRIKPFSTLILFILRLYLKLFFKKVIFVKHNHYPHFIDPAHSTVAKELISRIERVADITVCHMKPTENSKVYLPHPLFNAQGEVRSMMLESVIPKVPFYVIFGRISPYKKIHEVIENFPKTKHLLILGESNDESYLRMLYSLKGPNCTIFTKYVSDAEAFHILQASQGLINVNATPDMIVSGSIMFAISAGIPLYCCDYPFTRWLARHSKNNYVSIFNEVQDLCQFISEKTGDIAAKKNAARELQQHFSDKRIKQIIAEDIFGVRSL